MKFMHNLALPALAFLSGGALSQTPGVSDSQILFGESCALKGPARGLGKGMNLGLQVYFDGVNKRGGIHGRQLKLLKYNDGYEPKKAKITTRLLVEKKKVFALIGEVGTPTSKAVFPYVQQKQVPFIAPFTGAEFLRSPYKPLVVNVRGSYFQEMETLAKYLVDQKGLKKIACFYQNDGYGRAGLTGIRQALKRRGMSLCGEGSYKRNTIAINKGLKNIAASGAKAVIMVGAYKPCAQFIKQAKKTGTLGKAIFCNISFVGTKNLLKELGPAGEGCIVSQVVPFPWDTSVPLVAEYQKAMKKYGRADAIGFITLEGYMAGKLVGMNLEGMGKDVTREGFLKNIGKTGKFDLGGVILNFGPKDNQGMNQIFLTRFEGGGIKLVQAELSSPGK
jgi:ABC-type branched-subunit amino acid transport system substrate-binding protein